MNCRSCGSDKLELVLDLGQTPWCNDFLTQAQVGKEQFYPLRMMYCTECTLAQLDHTVSKETMFSNHTYVSGTTKTLARHFYTLSEDNVKTYNLKSTDLIVDIGGNDGTQLLQYQKLHMHNLVNVESATNIAELSVQAGINTINGFFNEELVDKNFKPHSAKLINAAGVFFHLEELHSVIRGVKKLLADDGIFVIQFMYLQDIITTHAFDSMYHEHLCYYSLHSLYKLLYPHGLVIHDAFHSEIHGGSMVVRVGHSDGTHPCYPTPRYRKLYENENCELPVLREFAKHVESKRTDLAEILRQLKNTGAKIYGYGAPAKSTTLLNYFGIDHTLLEKTVEVNKLKIGLYTPGSHIPIVQESPLDVPDYYLLLAWNFKDEILEREKGLRNTTTFITPFPEITLYKTKI